MESLRLARPAALEWNKLTSMTVMGRSLVFSLLQFEPPELFILTQNSPPSNLSLFPLSIYVIMS